MKKRKKKTGSRRGMQMVTLCISTTIVLVLLGLIVLSVQTSRNLSSWVKENLTVTVMLGDDVSVNDAKRLCRELYHRPYSKNIDYVSKEQALKEQTKAMGSDPSEFLGANPFVASLELQLKSDYANHGSLKWIVYELQMKSDYANHDSLLWIAKEIRKHPQVTDVAYQEDLMDNVNINLSRINIILLVLAVLLTFVSFSLINNTVRLSVYSRRFLIHTMKLVGASWGFIRRPFIRQGLLVGVLASVLAIAVLAGCVYALYTYEPNIQNIITWVELAITAGAVLLFGILITVICSWISVGKFLRMTAGEMYKI